MSHNNYPEDSVQHYLSEWWIEDQNKQIERGRLLWAWVPHVDQVPIVMIPEGRTEPINHRSATVRFESFHPQQTVTPPQLPVAALPHYPGEVRFVYRVKRRPVLVLGLEGNEIPNRFRLGQAKHQTALTLLVLPYYGAESSENRAGWNPAFVERIRRAEYPQYMWDTLPTQSTTHESILRFDHIQPIGSHHQTHQWTQFRLSDEALALVQEWFLWHLTGFMRKDGPLYEIREFIDTEFGR